MMIERKFNMFSTREWIQFLQYKLSPEREKELIENSENDPFLKDALEALSSQDARPIAFQSISYLISIVEENTGVSESKITRAAGVRSSSTPRGTTINPKLILLVLGGLLVAGLIGFGLYFLINNQSNNVEADSITISADTTSVSLSNYADSSLRPFDVIPGQSTVDTIPKPVINPSTSAKKPAVGSVSSSTTSSSSPSSPTPTNIIKNQGRGNERDLFDKAQELYIQDRREEAKKILRELKSYDNPMKEKAEGILTNIDKQ